MAMVQSPRLFNCIPSSTWSTLLNWFFLYKDNNFYLEQFKAMLLSLLQFSLRAGYARDAHLKAVASAVAAAAAAGSPEHPESGLPSSSADDNVWRVLLVELRLVPRMIAFYNGGDASLSAAVAAPSSSSAVAAAPAAGGADNAAAAPAVFASSTRSYILELSNHFRLASHLLSHHSFLWHHLHGSQAWNAFLPTLRAEARVQSHNLHVKPFPDPEPSVSPERAAMERALGFSLAGLSGGGGEDEPPPNPKAFVVPEGYGAGIELGSVFAYHMGYTDKPASSGASGAAGGGVSSAAKKKRKKKKNKKKKGGAAGGGEGGGNGGAGDEDGGDDDEEEQDATDADCDSGNVSDSSVASSSSFSSSSAAAASAKGGKR
jgi:hypothetical protein